MKKVLSLTLAVIMLLGLMPALLLSVSAEEANEGVTSTSNDGNYSLSLEKTTFKKGEPILVSANGKSYYDWVGIVAKGATNYDNDRWHYIGKCGYDVYYDVTRGKTLEAGEYEVYLVPNNGGFNLANVKIEVTVTDEAYDGEIKYPSTDYGDLTQLVTMNDQRVFKKGEPIMVAATGGSNHWIGIYNSPYAEAYLTWKGIDHMGGSGNYYDLNNAYSLTPGTYVIRLFSSWNKPYDVSTVAAIYITIVDEIDEEPDIGGGEGGTTEPDVGGGEGGTTNPDVGGGDDNTGEDVVIPETGAVTVQNNTHSLTVNKTAFATGEEILITATGFDSRDWIGIAPRGYREATIRWDYITTFGSGNTIDAHKLSQLAGDTNLLKLKELPEGLYTIYLIEKGEYLKNGYAFSINISVGAVEDDENGVTTDTTGGSSTVVPANPQSAIYDITGENGYATGTVTVTVPKDAVGSYNVALFWGDENGALEGYSSLARVKATAQSVSYVIDRSVFIPTEATRLLVYLENVVNGVLSEEFISIDLPQDSQADHMGEPIEKFYVVSDIHIGRTQASSTNFKKLIQEAITLNPDGVAIYIVGDMAEHGDKAELETLMSLYNEVLNVNGKKAADYPLYMAIGNHDYPLANSTFLEYATLPDGTQPSDTSYDFWLNGYHYIFLGGDNASGLGAYFNEETLLWLDQKLSENRDPSRPTFIFLHQSIYNTVAGSLPGEGWHGVTNADAFTAVISKYPEIMMFNGHSHWEMDSLSNAFNGTAELPIHAFNCASVSYLWNTSGQELLGSQGYYVQIYGDKVVVRGRDFANGQWVSAAQYVVEFAVGDDTTGGTDCEHSFEASILRYENGYLQKGIMKTVCTECGMEGFENTAPMIKFYGYSISTFNNSSICAGYELDFDLIAIYERVNGVEFTFGFTAAANEYLTGENAGKPINNDGTSAPITQGVVVNKVLPSNNKYLDLILVARDWTEYMERETIICAYVIEKDAQGNSSVGYICDENDITDTAIAVTYASLIKN